MNDAKQDTVREPPVHETGDRLPRVALMGEFSAGKSTLTNLLLSGTPLPVRVTATRLPPVWISYGEPGAVREDLDGNAWPVEARDLESVPLDQTRVIRLTMQEDILRLCDLIDMPGISDPNMASEVWERVLGEADHVLWCTHATQAWRQSEAAVWETLPDDLRNKSLLLVTRFDKIVSDRDRDRVLTRVRHEAGPFFAGVYPISLTEALKAGEDRSKWESSGAEAFVQRLIDLLMRPQSQPEPGTAGETAANDVETADPVDPAASGPAQAPVAPRRVRPGTGCGRARPEQPSAKLAAVR